MAAEAAIYTTRRELPHFTQKHRLDDIISQANNECQVKEKELRNKRAKLRFLESQKQINASG